MPEPPSNPFTVVLSEAARNDPAVLEALVQLGDALHLAAATSPHPPPAGRRRLGRGGPMGALQALPTGPVIDRGPVEPTNVIRP